jgi:NADH-quinone oxidoreductase subunit M
MPILSFFFIFFTLASIGLPGLNGFVSEFLTTLGAFNSPHLSPGYGSFAAIGIILGAVYMLHMAARVIFGPLKVPDVDHGHGQADQSQAAAPAHGAHDSPGHGPEKNDIGLREISILVPLAIVAVVLGVRPGIVLDGIRGPIENLRAVPAMPMTAQNAPTPAASHTTIVATNAPAAH